MIQRKAAISIILVFIGLVLLSGCAPLAVMGGEGTRVRATLRKIILREKIARMIYTMGMRFSNEESEQWQEIVELVDTDGIEGIHLWYGEASTSLTILNQMQKMSMIPILFDADLERDFQQRLPIPVPAAKIQPWSSSSRGNLSEECMSTGC